MAMRSYSTSDGSLVDDTTECSTPQAMCKTLPSTLTTVARVSVYEPAASDEDDKGITNGIIYFFFISNYQFFTGNITRRK